MTPERRKVDKGRRGNDERRARVDLGRREVGLERGC